MSAPNHNETINIKREIASTYELCGYAYTGGGRKITRCEVSIDNA